MPPLYQSPFPRGTLSTLWDAVILQIQSSTNLQAVRQWQVWQGLDEDTLPTSFTDLPAVRITPKQGGFTWSDEARFAGKLILALDYAVQGTRAGDLMDLFECIATALSEYATSAEDSTSLFINHLIPLGCYSITVTGPGVEPTLIAGAQGLSGTGTITLSVNLSA